MKEYIVTLKKDVDYDGFYDQMVEQNSIAYIPSREVEVANERPLSQRNTHFFLTDEEAEALRKDSRVLAVDIPPQKRDDIKISRFLTQSNNFNKTYQSRGKRANWGLLRVSESINVYGTSNLSPTSAYNYHLDGTGVDIVIQDSGLQVDHPEFYDKNGNSRVKQINWYTESGIAGSQSPNFYRDYHGHGTHVCGIAAGSTFGWAKNAAIYSLKVNGLEGQGDTNTGISINDCFDVIKGWHQNKPIDPSTGKKRPTVVNMSWGYSAWWAGLVGGNYRGSNWLNPNPQPQYGMVNPLGLSYPAPVRVASVDVDVEEMIDAGIIVCIAAGNNSHKIDEPVGLDYNNYYYTDTDTVYYHRGSSPYSTRAIIVGNIDILTTAGGIELKAESSNSGKGISVYAPGANVVSSSSTTNEIGGVPYWQNSSFKQANISGTSMASPQVAGICALFLQNNPDATPEQVKSFITKYSISNLLYTTGLDDDYTTYNSLWGGYNRYLYSPFSRSIGLQFSSDISYCYT